MPHLFQIHEEHLAELERLVPLLGEVAEDRLTPLCRTQLRRCKSILSDVRWNYGPHAHVERIPADTDDQAS